MKVNVDDLMSEFEKINQKIFTKNDILEVVKKIKKASEEETVFEGKGLRLEIKTRNVYFNNEKVLLAPLLFNLLAYFMERKNQLIMRDELLDDIWSGAYVGDRTIDVQVHALRQRFGKDIISTRKGYGYEWIEE